MLKSLWTSKPEPVKEPERPATRTERRPDGVRVYVIGYSGCGKTTWVRREVRTARRLLVWDGKEEWGERDGCRVVTSFAELRAACLSRKPERISFRVPVSREAFETFCRMAWVWCRAAVGTLVIEELADVTTTGRAPVAWGEIVRKCRGYGTQLYALTQRPQECDKTMQGNATVFHCGMMPDQQDQLYIARRCLGVDVRLVAALKPLQWIERDTRTHQVTTGITRPNSRK